MSRPGWPPWPDSTGTAGERTGLADGGASPRSGPGGPLFLKQYGEPRTGTNLVRLLLARDFDDVVVLMHVLGDKHAPPPAFDRLWEQAAQAADPAAAFVSAATRAAPAATTVPADEGQQAHLRAVAAPLREAMRAGQFGFVVSARDPYAWMASLLRWQGRSMIGAAGARAHLGAHVRAACARFNDNYAAWLALGERHPERWTLIRHEDVRRDPGALLDPLARRWGLQRRGDANSPVRGRVLPTHWDNVATAEHWAAFETPGAADRAARPALRDDLRALVTDTIDWALLERMGYEPQA